MIIERMAQELGVSMSYIDRFARGASHSYKVYSIAKRGGGFHTIHHPSKPLKALQRWLLVNVIDALPKDPAALAYRKHHSIFGNAANHASSKYLLRMDLKNFFPSITQVDLGKYIAERPSLFAGWTAMDIDTVCRIVCRQSVLTIGAPTSPALSNALCYDLDAMLQTLSARQDVTYTRYADDLFFSTIRPDVLRRIEEEVKIVISDLKLPANLRVNPDKTRHSSKRGARRVTGIVLGSDGHPHVGRDLKRKIRALVHKVNSLDPQAHTSLAGMIAYASGFEPEFMNSLIAKYGLPLVRKAMTPPLATK
jgi:RNA-directed DNA polymerase